MLSSKGLLVGQKRPLEPKHVWSIRVRLEIARSKRDLAIFNLAIDKSREHEVTGTGVGALLYSDLTIQ